MQDDIEDEDDATDRELAAACNFEPINGPPVEHTDARPGSEEKILILQRRYANRQELYHPADAPSIDRDEKPTYLDSLKQPEADDLLDDFDEVMDED